MTHAARPGRTPGAMRRRRLGSAVALVVLTFGVPLLLIGLSATLPLDPSALAPGAWSSADDGGLLLFVLLGIAWIAWAAMVLSIVVEGWSTLRLTATPRIPGLAAPQRLAAGLVAALLVSLAPPSGPVLPVEAATDGSGSAQSADRESIAAGTQSHPSVARLAAAAASSRAARAAPQERFDETTTGHPSSSLAEAGLDSEEAGPTITTRRHDTLWLLAEQHLGSGQRYTEIIERNIGVVQSDGRALSGNGRIYPGWTLRLPADAEVNVPRPDRHRVREGDTLWAIAEDELGAPTRYPEIVDLNVGDRQPDGAALRDPDLIRPGWVLELPSESVTRSGAEVARSGDGALPPAGPAPSVAEQDELLVIDRLPEPVDPSTTSDGERAPAPDGERAPAPDGAATADGASAPDGASVPEGASAPDGAADAVEGIPPLDRSGAAGGEPARDSGSAPALDRSTASNGDGDDPVAATRHGGPDRVEGDSVAPSRGPDVEPNDGAVVLVGGGALTSLLLAGFGVDLLRRRRQYQRYRRPGERMPAPGPDAKEAEAAARGALCGPLPSLLHRALAQLARSSARSGIPLPDVRLVRVTAESVELELESPCTEAVPPFRADDPRRWSLDQQQLDSLSWDGPRALPALVTLGTAGRQTILMNLDVVGTLALSGPDPRVAEVVRGLALELAFGTACELTERTLCLADTSVAELLEAGSMGVEPDPRAVATMLAAAMELVRSQPCAPTHGGPSGPQPADGAQPEGDPPHIVLADRPLSVVVAPRSGCALITSAQPAGPVPARLVVDDAGTALLLPEGQHLTPQTLPRASADAVAELVSCTELPTGSEGHIRAERPEIADGGQPVGAPDGDRRDGVPRVGRHDGTPGGREGGGVRGRVELDGGGDEHVVQPRAVVGDAEGRRELAGDGDARPASDPEPPPAGRSGMGEDVVIDLRDVVLGGTVPSGPPEGGSPPVSSRADAPRVLLLGEVRVENAHGKAESTRIGRLAETAAFVLLHPGARPSELQGALWPGRRSNPQTCRQMISRTRTWLGRTSSGTPHLMPFASTGGRLQLGDQVTSDWADFQELARIGLADPGDTAHLEAALALVRARPFGAVAARELPWADLHINEMISAITDVAHALATRHEEAGHRREAHDAALRGLLTECESELLEALARRTVP